MALLYITKIKQYKDNLSYKIIMYYYDSVEEQQYLLNCELYYNFDCNQYNSISEEVSLYNTFFSDEEINDYIPYGFLVHELRDLLPEFKNVVHLPIQCFM